MTDQRQVLTTIHERHELENISSGLHNQILLIQEIKNGDIPSTYELKKAVQTSVKELCTALIELVVKV